MLFGAFSKTVANLPVEAVIRAVEHQCKTLEQDISYKRLTVEEGFSILCFGQFIRSATRGGSSNCLRGLPPDHLEFYKETIVRLVLARQLPASAMDKFDREFAPA